MRPQPDNYAVLRRSLWLLGAACLFGCSTSSGGGGYGAGAYLNPQYDAAPRFGDAAGGGLDSSAGAGSDATAAGVDSTSADTAGAADTNTCTPNCAGLACGDDGCGGSCGTCPSGEACIVGGACQKLAPADLCKDVQCDPNAYCIEEDGKATCVCKLRWEGTGKSCKDVDECKVDNGGCDENAFCTNQVGAAPVCSCQDGFTGNGVKCLDVDECAMKADACAEHATCGNTIGGYQCECDAGFSGNGKVTCVDVDECASGIAVCPAEANCQNAPGSYVCICPTGYQKQGNSCVDVDECATGESSCDINATCLNTIGSHECSCQSGWSGNGKTCTKDDICKNAGCDPDAACSEATGGKCVCKPGTDGSGKMCFPAVVNVTMLGALISPKTSSGSCWDPGCTVTESSMAAVKNAAAELAKAFGDPTISAVALAAQRLELEKALVAITDKYSKPDVKGSATLVPGGATIALPNGGTAEDTLTPTWSGVAWKKVSLVSTVALNVELKDSDLMTPDTIGSVSIGQLTLIKVLALGGDVLVPTEKQGVGNVLGVVLRVQLAQKCGDQTCQSPETTSSCPADCASTSGGGGGGHFCDANCGSGNGLAAPNTCFCDADCKQYGDCCDALGSGPAGASCSGSSCGLCQ